MATRESDLHIYRDGKRPVTPPSDNVVPAGAKMKDAIKKYSLKSMEGRVFINRKKPGSKQANLRGLINIKDVHYVMAGWLRRQKDTNNPFYALRLRRIKTDDDEKKDDSTQVHLQKNGAGKDFSLHNMEGRVFKARKRIRHNFPDIRGLIDLEDVLYDVSGWYHIGKKATSGITPCFLGNILTAIWRRTGSARIYCRMKVAFQMSPIRTSFPALRLKTFPRKYLTIRKHLGILIPIQSSNRGYRKSTGCLTTILRIRLSILI